MRQKCVITYGENFSWQIVTCIGKVVLFLKLKMKNSSMSALYYITYIYSRPALEIKQG